ncbi:MAG: 16S rRNA (guanine(966)-N(2))-methyltransferase RsmD [Chloroflexota bacterium]
MRVISGTAKGRRLKSVPGDTTRPIMDRVKESLFNIVGQDVIGTRWLDLFAGTGQVGIEALSRGAAEVVFVDMAKAAIKTIWANVKHCRFEEGAEVIQSDSFGLLEKMTSGRWRGAKFDTIFIAPPQYLEMWHKAIDVIDKNPEQFLFDGGEVIVQVDPFEYKTKEGDIVWEPQNLVLNDQRKYGRTLILFYDYEKPESN